MLNPVELFVGMRYLRAKRRTRFVSFITLISLVGIALGVAALIVILSVMNGFEGELRNRLLSMSAHGTVSAADGAVEDWRTLVSDVADEEGVLAAAPFVNMEGMVQAGGELHGVVVHGIEPNYEKRLSGEQINMIEGGLDVLQASDRRIILGRVLAFEISARIGDGVVLLIPRTGRRRHARAGAGTLRAGGVFEAGLSDHDSVLALVHIADAASILGIGDAASRPFGSAPTTS